MKKYTLREIKRFVSLGVAQDITTASRPAIHEPFEKIGYSAGIYGINGGLLQGKSAYGGGEWPLVRRSVAAVRPEWPP